MSLAESLREIPLFSQLREGDLERIARAAHERTYAKNSIIAFADQAGDALYVVLSGQVKLVLTAEDGREVILSTRNKGDFFGDLSLIDDEPLDANAVAMEDSTLLVLRRDDFQRCLEEIPQMGIGLLRALCKRLRQADTKIGSLVLLDVPGRVAALLIELADQNDGVTIAQRVTHHLIAQMVGASRETVSRTMSDLVGQGLIEVTRRNFTIHNRREGEPVPRDLIEVSHRTLRIRDREALETMAGKS